MQNSSRLHRGFIEACSRLSKTIGFTMQNSSRLHRGFIEAFKNHWFYYTKLIEARSRLLKTIGFIMQNSWRLARGFQKPLVLLYKTHRGSLEAFKNYWFYYTKLIEARSRLSKTICFIIQNSSRLARGSRKGHWRSKI
jgi:hypothetical protein